MTIFTKQSIENIGRAIRVALKEVSAKYGCDIDIGTVAHTTERFTATMIGKVIPAPVADSESSAYATRYLRKAESLGFQKAWLGRKFTHPGLGEFTLIGLRKSGRSPVCIRRIGQSMSGVTVDVLKESSPVLEAKVKQAPKETKPKATDAAKATAQAPKPTDAAKAPKPLPDADWAAEWAKRALFLKVSADAVGKRWAIPGKTPFTLLGATYQDKHVYAVVRYDGNPGTTQIAMKDFRAAVLVKSKPQVVTVVKTPKAKDSGKATPTVAPKDAKPTVTVKPTDVAKAPVKAPKEEPKDPRVTGWQKRWAAGYRQFGFRKDLLGKSFSSARYGDFCVVGLCSREDKPIVIRKQGEYRVISTTALNSVITEKHD